MNYEIQDYNGDVVIASVTVEELESLKETGEFNYFEHDLNPENDLVERWIVAVAEGHDVSNHRIYKKINEE
jgi:siroheme synthase (precorrin-2 oxidase/ferrochelatase)